MNEQEKYPLLCKREPIFLEALKTASREQLAESLPYNEYWLDRCNRHAKYSTTSWEKEGLENEAAFYAERISALEEELEKRIQLLHINYPGYGCICEEHKHSLVWDCPEHGLKE